MDPTTREVLAFMRETIGLATRQAQQCLRDGLAGPATGSGRARRYDSYRVLALADVAELSDDEVDASCPAGVFIGRVGPHRHFHLDTGADITGYANYGEQYRSTNRHGRLMRFDLVPPGGWYAALEGRRLSLGPGYPWKLRGAPVSASFDRTGLASEEELQAAAARVARRRGAFRQLPPPPAPPAHR